MKDITTDCTVSQVVYYWECKSVQQVEKLYGAFSKKVSVSKKLKVELSFEPAIEYISKEYKIIILRVGKNWGNALGGAQDLDLYLGVTTMVLETL